MNNDERCYYLTGWMDSLKFTLGYIGEIVAAYDAVAKVGEQFDWDDRYLDMLQSFKDRCLEELQQTPEDLDEMGNEEVKKWHLILEKKKKNFQNRHTGPK